MPAKPRTILQLNSARKFVGEAAHTLNLTEALRRGGHRVFLGLRKDFDTFKVALEWDLDPIGFNMGSRWWPPKDVPDLRGIARLVKEHQIEVIHAHRGKDHWQAIAAVRLFGLRVPVVRTRHVVTPLRSHAANRWQANRTDRLIAVSRAIEADVASTGMYEGDRLVRIPGGIDVKRFKRTHQRELVRSRLGIPVDAKVVICVARFATVKAHNILIAAWKTVLQKWPDAVLLLVGGGRLDDELRDQVLVGNLNHRVRFYGRANIEEIPDLLESADLGTMASVGSEGFSRAVLEYMAMGLPVVATSVGALPDLIDENQNGRLVIPRDPLALGRALSEALALPPETLTAWGVYARSKAEKDNSYEAWVSAHEAVYGAVTGS